MGTREQVHEALGQMTDAERKVAHSFLANYPSSGLSTVAEFAELAGTSAPTVLRFVSRLGFSGYPEFQRALRAEIQAELLSPLEKGERSHAGSALGAYFDRAAVNIAATLDAIPESEFEAACALLSDHKAACYCLGGRFSDAIARYMAAHLRIVRPNVRRFQDQTSTWDDQLLDVKASDVVVLFDIRRYQRDLVHLSELLGERRARIVLITDNWLSPISRYAKVVLPCAIDAGRTWDSSVALLALVEAIIDRVTHKDWDASRGRIQALEHIHWNKPSAGG
ncbi:MurR/RpiR family transcriptional regulator [Nitratireductor pacificus]|uniref:SIS domain-containing protein n=1 Tax=Nitratireductor pacificus pht-3B TaxID=391937 RepID=K2MM03_9HYPH|nr:MurR/RpiR family transcriptional regulator [Nitratireductor pacificus]EKF18257.1 SIS domain-containing protein [Nitratireductor pacificus pht-3B]